MPDTASRADRHSAIRDRWIAAGLSTAPADRPSASAAIHALYRAAGLHRPRLEWYGSPVAAIRRLRSPELADRFLLAGRLDRERRTPGAEVWHSHMDWAEAAALRHAVAVPVWQRTGRLLEATALQEIRIQNPRLRALSDVALLGQHDAPAMAMLEILCDVQSAMTPKSSFRPLKELARSTGVCIPLDGVCLMAERHHLVRHNEHGLLHASAGPALAYPDGMSIYAWEGVSVPSDAILDPASITADRIEQESDPQIRRALIDIHGTRRFLEARARLVHEDAVGRLWASTFPGGTWLLVEVENGTTEPDGTRRRHYLRVPPTMRTAREAVAWTYGLRAEDYELVQRT